MSAQLHRCGGCKRELPREAFYISRSRHDGRAYLCKACHRPAMVEYRRRQRWAVIEAMGGRCAACGTTDYRVLCFDHVDGGGTRDRAALGGNPARILADVKANPGKYQLLCWNCNAIKMFEERLKGLAAPPAGV